MSFFDRYNALCEAHGMKPAADSTTKPLGISRANVTQWKQHGYVPNAKTLILIADVFNVSVDYLLGRTDDPTDYSKIHTDKIQPIPHPASNEDIRTKVLISRYERLRPVDRERVDNLMVGLLAEAGSK